MDQPSKPIWRTHHPRPPHFVTEWSLIALIVLGVVLVCIAISPMPVMIVSGMVILLMLGLVMLIDLMRICNTLGRTQICPMCGREAPYGYTRCLCGYPER